MEPILNKLSQPKTLFAALFIISFLIFNPSLQAAELKIGFVNILKVLDLAPQAKQADARLKQEFAPKEKDLARSRDAIRRLEERLRKEEDTMSARELSRLAKDLRAQRREFEREQEALREDFNFRRNEELNKLQKDIFKAIVSLSKDEGYDLVVGEGVIYASEQVDITDQLLKRLGR